MNWKDLFDLRESGIPKYGSSLNPLLQSWRVFYNFINKSKISGFL
jgi:hypothetical protein